MADQPPDTDTGDEGGVGLDRASTSGTPGWVKVFGVVGLAVVVLFVVLLLFGPGGGHGPGRHAPAGGSNSTSGTPGGHTGSPAALEHRDRPP